MIQVVTKFPNFLCRFSTFQSNRLTIIRRNMFSGTRNLLELHLYDNDIHTIESGSFKASITGYSTLTGINEN